MSCIDHMNNARDKYQDYAQLVQFKSTIVFYCATDKLAIFDHKNKDIIYKVIDSKLYDADSMETFRFIEHFKDLGKVT